MKRIIITEHQLFSITALYTCGSAVIMVSAGVAAQAKHDAWLSGLITPVWGLFVLWIITSLGKLYPHMTYIEVIRTILGKWLGGLMAASFVFFSFRCAAQIPWFMGSFLTTQAMPETPEYAVNIIFVAGIAIALIYGIEAVARASEVFIIQVSVLMVVTILMVLPNAKAENLLPVLERGLAPVFAGSLILANLMTFPVIILFMVYPRNLKDADKAKKAMNKGYLWGGLLMCASILTSILVLGGTVTEHTKYTVYMLAKEINLGVVFSRLEFVIAAVWIITLFIKGFFYSYAAAEGLSQLLGLKDYKRIVIPFGLILLITSGIIFPNTDYQEHWDKYVLLPYEMTYGFVLPSALLLIHYIKEKLKKMEDV